MRLPLPAMMLVIAACPGASNPPAQPTQSIGGIVTGLETAQRFTLGGETLVLSGDGRFQFSTPVPRGSSYEIAWVQDFSLQICSVGNGSGVVADADVTNVEIRCSWAPRHVEVAVTGIVADVVLDLNGERLTYHSDGSGHGWGQGFTPVAVGAQYTLTVVGAPAGQECTVRNGAGTIAKGVDVLVSVECAARSTYQVSGDVAGLAGTLRLGLGTEELSITSDGRFSFAASLPRDVPYSVAVLAQPPGQTCHLEHETGSAPRTATTTLDVTNVWVSCAPLDVAFQQSAMAAFGANEGWSVALGAAGEIYIAAGIDETTCVGHACVTNAKLVVSRLLMGGALDVSFGTNGGVLGKYCDSCPIAVDASGRVVVLASATVTRLSLDGTPDASFGGTGAVFLDYGFYGRELMAVDAADRVVVASQRRLARLRPDGILDASFNGTGIVEADSYFAAIAVRPDGGIAAFGWTLDPPASLLRMYQSDGSPDARFGDRGTVVLARPPVREGCAPQYVQPEAIALDAAGRFVLAGTYGETGVGCGQSVVVWRILADGSADPTFGENGIARTPGAAHAIALDASGRILVTGSAGAPAKPRDLGLWRMNANGTLDASFNASGVAQIRGAIGRDIAIDGTGGILVSGDKHEPLTATVWRFLP